MTDPITPARIAELRDLLKTATPGAWRIEEYEQFNRQCVRIESAAYSDEEPGICGDHSRHWRLIHEDAALIVALRNAAPALLDRIDHLEREIQRLRAGLEGPLGKGKPGEGVE